MRSYEMLEARGFTLFKQTEHIMMWHNRFRGWNLKIDLKNRRYILYDYRDNSAVEVTPKLHKALMVFMNENWWFDFHKTRDIRESLGIGLKEMSNACKVHTQLIRDFEMGVIVPNQTKLKIYKFYIERGIDV